MNKIPFSELPISEEIKKAVADMGFVEASPIQSEAIPIAASGQDVLGMAQTGTGKTAAFGIPTLDKIDESARYVQALVICPTRELALQVTEEFKKLAKYKKISCVTVYGGDSIERQIRELKSGAQVVIGTPGRLIDHLERKTLKIDRVKVAILDEADEMLDMGFREDIESILEQLPPERQTLLFSATMSKQIMQITKRFQNNPQLVKVVKNELTAQNIEQISFEVKSSAKNELITRLIDLYQLKQIIVFCNTKKKVDEVVEALLVRGYEAEGLHGDLRQQQRNNVMSKFRSGITNILVATDVAARGIDVLGVDAVVNFDIPLDPEYYVHRIGRTGRAGQSGRAFTLISGRESYRLREIEQYTKVKIDRGVVPTFEDVVGVKKAKFIERVKAAVEEGDLNVFEDMIPQLHHAGLTDEQIITALIKLSIGIQKNEFSNADLADNNERGSKFNRERGNDRFGKSERYEKSDRFNKTDREDRFNKSDSGDRFNRSDSGDRFTKREPRQPASGMVRLFVNIGKLDRVRPNDIVGALTGETGVAFGNIGQIDIYDKYSFVEINKQDVQKVIQGMENNTIKGKTVNIEVAKP
ncbi:MAG: DEAD/DEAH box helicase [Verrucomicrobia bacterium]|nr:DEAD/DEAH box helicase [Cytophagales bacterium]